MDKNLFELEKILKNISEYEKNGLDTSYLKSFIKQYKVFITINDIKPDIMKYSDNEKFNIIRNVMDDKAIFPTINDIILFANKEMGLGFKSQKVSREMTIERVLKRVEKDPEFKNKLKQSLIWLIEETSYHPQKSTSSSKINSNSIDLDQWVKMLKDL
jgi:hypothetical protein